MKWFLGAILFLGMVTALDLVYGAVTLILNAIVPNRVDFWTVAGVLSTIGLGGLVLGCLD
jgi:hypothetical protein